MFSFRNKKLTVNSNIIKLIYLKNITALVNIPDQEMNLYDAIIQFSNFTIVPVPDLRVYVSYIILTLI